MYKVEFKSSSTFQITRFLVAPSVWKPFDCLSLSHVVLKLKYRAKSDSTFAVSVEKLASNKDRTSSFVLNIYRNSSNDEKSLWRRLSIP